MASKAAKGKRAKTRHKISTKGSRVTVNNLLQKIPVGSKVDIKINASIHKGMPFRRYHGYTGTVTGMQGKSFLVEVFEGGDKQVELIIGPAHLTVSEGTRKPETKEEMGGKVAA